MKKILIIEDSSTVVKILRHLVQQQPGIEAFYAVSRAEGEALYTAHAEELFAAVVDLNLPDAPDGEMIDFLLDRGLPVIVLTAQCQDDRREKLLSKGVVDYVLKEGRYSYQRAINLLIRLEKNQSVKILVAEDSKPARQFVKNMLRRHLFQVIEAENGIDALDKLAQDPGIAMLITDYHMPEMDGFELIKTIRRNPDQVDLIIIGLSGESGGAVSAKFIKNGANDFLNKPFYHEEFYCRVTHCLEERELLQQIRDIAHKDDLTGLSNRRFFFERGRQLHQQALANKTPMAVAVIDIDHFKTINDNYGHMAGDSVLAHTAQELMEAFPRFIVARTGGEEFAVIMPGLSNAQAYLYVDKFRAMFAAQAVEIGDESLQVTLSIGVSNRLGSDLDNQIQICEALLCRAKEAGRNFVTPDDDES